MTQRARKFKKVQANKSKIFFREIAFLAVLNFFLVQKLVFGHFLNCKKWNLVIFEIAKMEFGQKKFREIDLFDFTILFGLDFF